MDSIPLTVINPENSHEGSDPSRAKLARSGFQKKLIHTPAHQSGLFVLP